MNNIKQTGKEIKKKLSFGDYDSASHQQAERPVIQQASQPASQHTSMQEQQQEERAAKIKVTYYLSEDDHNALTDIYIKRLQHRMKVDKSSLISEAIQLLYKKEIQ